MKSKGLPKVVVETTSLGQFFFQSMKLHGGKTLQYVSETDKTNTFEEILIRCIRVALKLKEKGIGKDDIVSTCSLNHENSCVPLIATLFLGAITANFDPNLSHLDTIGLLDLIRPKIIFVSEEAMNFMENCIKEAKINTELVVFGRSDKYDQFSYYIQPHPQENDFEPVPTNNNKETAAIMFSSGTTGFPKGICLSHYSLLANTSKDSFYIVRDENNCEKSSVILLYSNLYWISSLSSLIRCMQEGYSRVICPVFEAVNTWRLIEKYKVTFIFLPPYQAVEFLDQRPKDVDSSSLEIFMTGSSHVPKKLMEDLKIALPHTIILNGYGQTETTGMITAFDPSIPEGIELQNRKPQSCGKIKNGYIWKVVDTTTEKPLGPNQEGELRVQNDTLMNGYYKLDTSPAYDAEGYLKTGDITYYDEDECFYIIDRIKEMFKYRGWHILPAMLEEILMSHPAVKEAAVIEIPHEIDGDHPMGVVVLFDGYKHVTAEEIQLFFDEKVSDSQKLRAGVRIVGELSRTTTGKLKRRALKQKILKNEL